MVDTGFEELEKVKPSKGETCMVQWGAPVRKRRKKGSSISISIHHQHPSASASAANTITSTGLD
eukprot:10568885-Lingulodinium_polyedra.AAC.1